MYALAFMSAWVTTIKNRRDEEGATAVEYGLIVALIAVAIIAGITLLGDKLGALFEAIGEKVSGVTGDVDGS